MKIFRPKHVNGLMNYGTAVSVRAGVGGGEEIDSFAGDFSAATPLSRRRFLRVHLWRYLGVVPSRGRYDSSCTSRRPRATYVGPNNAAGFSNI